MKLSPKSAVSNIKGPWDDLIEDFLLQVRATKKPATHVSYAKQLQRFRAWIGEQEPPIEPGAFKAKNINQFLVDREVAGISRTTRRYDAIIIKMCLRHGVPEYLPHDPLRDYRIPRAESKEQYCPTTDDNRRILQAIEDRWNVNKNPKCRYVREKSVGSIGGAIRLLSVACLKRP